MKTETSHIKTAIILVSETGMASARLLHKVFPAAPNFNRYDAFIFIGALGICVRSIAPCVKDKYTDPAVICVDSIGKHAISVLSGHIGGANELTEAVAGALGAEPVITTQSDLTGLWALDKLPQRFGWSPTICVSPSTHLLAGLTQTPDDQMKACMNEAISLFVTGQPTALLLEIRDKGTDWMEANLPPHVEVFYQMKDIKLSRFKLVLIVSPRIHYNIKDIPSICYVPRVVPGRQAPREKL